MNTKDVTKAIDSLLETIIRYKIKGITSQIDSLKYLRNYLENDCDLSTREKLNIYQDLFPPHGGLTEVHYWHNDFESRKKANEIISSSKNLIADYLLDRH